MTYFTDCSVYVPDYGALDDAEKLVNETGAGKCYGQLVVLGYKEYVVKGGELEPKGDRNVPYALMMREAANGIRKDRTVVKRSAGNGKAQTPVETYCITMRVKPKVKEETKVVVTSYIPDAALDMFQIGRLSVKQNDFCLR